MSASPDPCALLLRRAGFGATMAELAAARAQGYSATVDALVAGLSQPDPGADGIALPALTPPPADYLQLKTTDPAARRAVLVAARAQTVALTNWWLARMVATTNPLREKLAFLLHGHFPTAVSKVRFPSYMYGQNQLFRTLGPGDFDNLTQAVATDPAMLIWLDASSDKAADPNENFARELMERFTMGVGTYSENDVRAAAYCFSGWTIDLTTNSFRLNLRQHSAASQTFLGQSGVNSGQQVIDIATGSHESARYVPCAFWSHLAYPVQTDDVVVADLVGGYSANRNVTALLDAIFNHPEFTSAASRTGLVKQPTEYVVGALRALGVSGSDVLTGAAGLQTTLADLGQVLFDPPSVGGWSQNEYWLSTSAALARWSFASRLAAVADISHVADAPIAARLDAAAELLSLDGWSTTTSTALRRAAGDPETLLTLALVSPEFVTN